MIERIREYQKNSKSKFGQIFDYQIPKQAIVELKDVMHYDEEIKEAGWIKQSSDN